MILYKRVSKDYTKRLLKYIKDFDKDVGYKIITQKSVAFVKTAS